MKECQLSPSRLTTTMIIVLMVILSPVVMLVNPTLKAAPSTIDDYTSLAPSTIGQGSPDFTTQAALSSLTARPTNNIVNTNSFYDVVFLTATSGVIKTIQVTFPAGTTIGSGAFFNEAEGIGPGTASKSGQTITYTVTNAVNVPAGTKIRLEFANINNPLPPSSNYKVTVTTRNAANAIIDGPTQSTAYTMKQIGVNAIADNSVTTTKVADGAITSQKLSADANLTQVRELQATTVVQPTFPEAILDIFCDSPWILQGGSLTMDDFGTGNVDWAAPELLVRGGIVFGTPIPDPPGGQGGFILGLNGHTLGGPVGIAENNDGTGGFLSIRVDEQNPNPLGGGTLVATLIILIPSNASCSYVGNF